MSSDEYTPRRGNDLDFLKSIVGDDRPRISRIDEMSEDDSPGHSTKKSLSKNSSTRHNDYDSMFDSDSSPPTPKTKSPHRIKVDIKDAPKHEVKDEDLNHKNRDAIKGDVGELGTFHKYKPLKKTGSHKRPRSAHPLTNSQIIKKHYGRGVQDLAAYKLEQKYIELKQLLQGSRPDGAGASVLIKAASRMAQRYHMEAMGGAPVSHQPSPAYPVISPGASRVLEQLGLDGTILFSPRRPSSAKYHSSSIYSPKSESELDSYILIDGTGSHVSTRRVVVTPREPAPDHLDRPPQPPPHHNKVRRGRAAVRRPPSGKKNAWGGSNANSQMSQKSTPQRPSPRSCSRSRSRSKSSIRSPSSSNGKPSKRKSKSDYSDSFDSDSSRSRSRSRSRSKSNTRTVDLHLKYTKNEKLLEWLKDKDRMYKEQKRKERKEKKEKRKQMRVKAEEKEKLREKSEIAVEEWMKQKALGPRLLRRRRRTESNQLNKNEEEWILYDETLDLKDYGAKIDPDKVPKVSPTNEHEGNESQENAKNAANNKETAHKTQSYPKPLSGRPTSGRPAARNGHHVSSLMSHSRPASKPQTRFSEGAKEKAKQLKEKVMKEEDEKKKKRQTYDEWLKTKRTPPKKIKDNEDNEKEVKNKEEVEVEKKPVIGVQTKKPKESDKNNEKKLRNNQEVKSEREPGVGAEKEESNDDINKGKEHSDKCDSTTDSNVKLKIESKVRKARPGSAKGPKKPDDNVPPAKVSETEPQTSNITPRPAIPQTEAYKAVKHEQKSWEKFGDFVWNEANNIVEEENEEMNGENCLVPPESVAYDDKTNIRASSVDSFSDRNTTGGNQTDNLPGSRVKDHDGEKKIERAGSEEENMERMDGTPRENNAGKIDIENVTDENKTSEKDLENKQTDDNQYESYVDSTNIEDKTLENSRVITDPVAEVQTNSIFLTATE